VSMKDVANAQRPERCEHSGDGENADRPTSLRNIGKESRGPSIKNVTLEGEGVREGVTVCDRGGG